MESQKKQIDKGKTVTQFDFTLVGGGIVGTATALELKRQYPDAAIALIEKEDSLASHQTGHNSGVIHAGVYYQPGSLKADFCRRGADRTIEFCKKYNLPFEQCGKLLVATNPLELKRLHDLEERCVQNKIVTQQVSRAKLREMEPNITGLGAILVPATAITDYIKITRKMADLFTDQGGSLFLGQAVTSIREKSDSVVVTAGKKEIQTRYLIACGGLMADRLARMMNIDIDFRIIPFRGEYYALPKKHADIVSRLIYPVPDPDLPFLGVHLTPMVDGSVTVGPNAVLGWKREGYGRVNIDLKDILEMVGFSGFWKVMGQNLISGVKEFVDSNYKAGYLKRIQKYCPSLELQDLKPYPAGIRAQAVQKDGTLVHDFLFATTKRSLHVCNAPSPAATSAMPIAEYLCQKAKETFGDI
ncbi:MAG: L-2-hydroxyglutarate oxidase [Desulfobacteraceae bacterium]|nr:L-2-hydroxyglutarate oxidase [Desulfobacteraceae bacterium]